MLLIRLLENGQQIPKTEKPQQQTLQNCKIWLLFGNKNIQMCCKSKKLEVSAIQ